MRRDATAEHSRAEQSRAEQSRAEQSRAEQTKPARRAGTKMMFRRALNDPENTLPDDTL